MNYTKTLKTISFSSLKPSPLNTYKITEIEDLKASILTCGLITPLSVVGPAEDGSYEILSGERRYTSIKELLSENAAISDQVPCYVVGDSSMPTLVKRLLIESSNILSRGISDLQSRRFELVSLIKQIAEENEEYKDIVNDAGKYLKVSDRYKRMYFQIFDNAVDELQNLAKSGDIRINDASRLSSIPKPEQEKAVKELKEAKNATEKAAIASKYTGAQKAAKTEKAGEKETVTSIPLAKQQGSMDAPAKPLEDSILELETFDETQPFDFSSVKEYSEMDVDIDTTNQIKKIRPTEKKQNDVDTVIAWCNRMMQCMEPSDEEWEAIDACRRVIDRFA